ncbi:LysR family transcriptional regulator [Geomicrobium sp. JCM 19055]|uniref:LysR family transcriptional regulator n=1 Tax=Geomicrobium sp. JCM 19055 TaxID=1460649 RepID=UPI000694EA86|nr:LysR family transcriptional regulator [Geomicrobium sp. JCM 19055]
MEWQYIKYFLKVAEYEHMTKASQELSITQPALSRSISKLEEELRVPLFIRENKRIKLNKYGRMFREHAFSIQKEMEIAKKNIEEQLHPNQGEISIGFFHTLGINKLPSLLAGFKAKYPKTTFKLKQANKTILIDSLYNGDLDFCFTTLTGEELGRNYKSIDLWEEKLFFNRFKSS